MPRRSSCRRPLAAWGKIDRMVMQSAVPSRGSGRTSRPSTRARHSRAGAVERWLPRRDVHVRLGLVGASCQRRSTPALPPLGPPPGEEARPGAIRSVLQSRCCGTLPLYPAGASRSSSSARDVRHLHGLSVRRPGRAPGRPPGHARADREDPATTSASTSPSTRSTGSSSRASSWTSTSVTRTRTASRSAPRSSGRLPVTLSLTAGAFLSG